MPRNFYSPVRRVLCKGLPALASAFLLLISVSAKAYFVPTDYQFSSSNAAYTPISGGTTLIAGSNAGAGTFNDAVVSGVTNIGFSFQFDCTAYTQFSVTPSGYLVLGGTAPASVNFNNDLSTSANYPIIAPWWDHQHLYDNGGAANGCAFNPLVGVHYVVTGTAPNRILKIEFNTQVTDATGAYWWAGCGVTMNRYQAWLYEGTNNIEFRYGSMWTAAGQPTAATIGIGGGATNFLSLTPDGAGSGTTSSAVSNNLIALHVTGIPAGTVYKFSPCYIKRTGNGTQAPVSMAPGSNLFTTTVTSVGTSTNFTPFTLDFPAGCASHNYSMTITGPQATEYKFGATNNQTTSGSMSGGSTLTPVIIFSPTAAGTRNAVLTINDITSGCSATFNLQASGCAAPIVTQTPSSICPGGVQTITVSGAGAAPATFTAPGTITVPAGAPATSTGPASPYGSPLVVSGLPTSGVIVKSVTINGVVHTFPADMDILLQSPTLTNVVIMSDAGDGTDATGQNYTFDDAAAAAMVTTGLNPSGTYKPTNSGAADTWVAPGPGAITQATPTLASFSGNPNGTWNLFVVDDASGDVGSISSWSITFTVLTPVNAVFSPTTGLFINPAATTPYTGTPVSTVYASPGGTSNYIVTDPTCPGSPVVITVTVNPLTVITVQPTNSAIICGGTGTTFTVGATGTGTLTYQWQVSTDGGATWTNLVNGAPYSNVTTATLGINPVTAAMNGYLYRAVVTGTCSVATSNSASLSTSQLRHSSITATPSTTCSPGTSSIDATAAGGVVTGGIGVIGNSGTINLPIPDNTPAGINTVINIPATTIPNAGSLKIRINAKHTWVGDLKFTLTSPCGTTFLFDRPGVPVLAAGNLDNLGTDATAAPPSAVYTFDIAGATVIPELAGATGFIAAGTYKPSDVNGVAQNWAGFTFPCAAGGAWTLNISDNAILDQGTLVDWQILGPSTSNYTHAISGPGTITTLAPTGPNNESAHFTATALPAGNNVFTVTSTDAMGCSVSSTVTVVVNQTPTVTITPAAPVICAGDIVQLTANVTPATTQTFASGALNLAIPDNTPAGITTPAIVLPALSITSATNLRVMINARHSWVGDLKFTLTSPCGTTFLFDRPGVPLSTVGNLDNLGTSSATTPPPAVYTFDLSAATVIPETAGATGFIAPGSYKPSDVNGVAHNWAGLTFPCAAGGNWTLTIADNAVGDLGALIDWAIIFAAPTPAVWSPLTNLYSNAAATTAYTGTPATTVWAKPPTTATYQAVATVAGCSSAPASVTVTVNQLPAITVQPVALAAPICPGFNVTYSVTATGAGLTYQWQVSTDNGVTYNNIVNGVQYSNATTNALTINNVGTGLNGYRYRVIVSGTCPPAVTSNAVTLVVATPPTITTQPANVTVCANSNAVFTVVAAGVPAPTIYQWQVSTDGGATWTNLTTGGSYTPTFTVTSAQTTMSGYRYRVIVTNSCGQTITSSAAILTVNPFPVVTAGALPAKICISDTLVGLSGSPVGGSWSGIGVSGFNFVPSATAIGSYTLTYTYTNSFGCTATASVVANVQDCPERIRLLRNDAVVLFPNPNNGKFFIRINSTLYNYLGMKVYNSAGQLLNGRSENDVMIAPTYSGLVYGRVVPIDLSYLPAGTYMVKFYYDDGIRTSEKTFTVIIGR